MVRRQRLSRGQGLVVCSRPSHQTLPYPSNTASIKTSRTQGLKAWMMCFSGIYADPGQDELPFLSHPLTLYGILWKNETTGIWGWSRSAYVEHGSANHGMPESRRQDLWVEHGCLLGYWETQHRNQRVPTSVENYGADQAEKFG
ncbi:hypothetical protein B0O99DRAFT_631195 [Bisporella sp. PMI_857]|nr:hypothetical protein B0O99DRAFT_631195 [Bisporella sp. PMI_857]